MRIVNGLVTFDNAKTAANYQLSRIGATISLPNLDAPFKLAGKATYKDQELALDASVSRARVLFGGGTADLAANVKGDLVSASFTGQSTFGDKLALDGATKVESASVRKLAGWLGKPISGSTGFGPLSVSGHAAFAANRLAFEDAKLHFDDIDATGALAIDLSGARPSVTGTLVGNKLDLRPYTGSSTKGGGASGDAPKAKDSSGWSKEPIDASALKSFDAALTLSADQIFIRDLTIGKSQLAITVAGGVLTADVKQLALYSGAGRGKVVLDGRETPATLSATMSLSGLDLGSFMKDAAKTDRFQGTGNFDVDLKGSGHSQAELVADLNGTTKLAFTNGAIKGVDLDKIASMLQAFTGKGNAATDAAPAQDTTGATSAAPAQTGQAAGDTTRFATLGATFAVAQGVMKTDNFAMTSDLVSLTGGGTIDLVHMTIDFRVNPGKDQKNGGLKIAMHVGPLGHPKISADASAFIANELQKRLGNGSAGQLLNGLIGGDKSAAPADGSQPAKKTGHERPPQRPSRRGTLGSAGLLAGPSPPARKPA